MSVTFNAIFNAGSSRSGLVGRVAYSLDGATTWVTSGVTEPISGSGSYQASVTVTPPAVIYWKTGDADRVSTVVTQTAGGSGYTNGTGYALGLSGGGGTGAAGTFDVASGAVTNIVITAQGSGYTAVPTLSFTGAGSGTGAAATAALVVQRYASESIAPVVVSQIGGGVRTVTQDWNGPGSLTVEDSVTGLPIANATLKAYLQDAYAASPSQASLQATTTTDASGHWTLSLAPAAYTITVTLSGYATVALAFDLIVN